MQICSEGFVGAVYRDIKAAASSVRTGGNALPEGVEKSHPGKQDTPQDPAEAKWR